MAAKCACGRPPAVGDPPSRVVTLVHGTYARHAEWMQDGEPFPDAIRSVDGTLIHRFCWRGRNRHLDRIRGANALREHLLATVAAHPEAEHYAIGHSHGGNVVLYALRDGGAALEQVRVTTLGTPFLSMNKRPVSRGLLLMAAFVGVVFIANTINHFATAFPFDTAVEWFRLVYYGGAALGSLLALILIVGSVLVYGRGTSAGVVALLRGRATDSEAARFSSPSVGEERLLVVRANGDEASAALGFAQLTSWALKRLLALLRSTVAKWVIGLAFLGVVVLDEESLAWEIVSWLAAGPLIAIGLTVALLTFAYLPFGIDMLFWTLHASVTAAPSPPGYGSVFQSGVADDGELAHSVYNDPAAIDVVKSWLSGEPIDRPGAVAQ